MKWNERTEKEIRAVPLTELLDAREARARYQQELLSGCGQEGVVLVSVTLNIPGPVKDRLEYRRVLVSGMQALFKASAVLSADILHREVRYLSAGPEGYLLIGPSEDCSPVAVKNMTVHLEDTLPLGRLFDMDVISSSGTIRREDIGIPERRCLLCNCDAKICGRSRRHSLEELLAKIETMIEESGI